jgi:hypothetical protein
LALLTVTFLQETAAVDTILVTMTVITTITSVAMTTGDQSGVLLIHVMKFVTKILFSQVK